MRAVSFHKSFPVQPASTSAKEILPGGKDLWNGIVGLIKALTPSADALCIGKSIVR
jgi:hypothetical protein